MGEREIQQLARRCAVKGLRLKQARTLFDARYIGDVLAATGGSISKAAALAGIQRESMQRLCGSRKDGPSDDT